MYNIYKYEKTSLNVLCFSEKQAMTEVISSTVDTSRRDAASKIVARFSKYAAVGGLVPIPVLDMAAVAGVQVKMLEHLSTHYGVPFMDNVGKEVVGAIIGAGASYNLANATLMGLSSYIRLVPVAGQLLGLAIMPAFAAASTAALGRLFIDHFESGGTLLDVDVEAARSAFKADFVRSKKSKAKAVEPDPAVSAAA